MNPIYTTLLRGGLTGILQSLISTFLLVLLSFQLSGQTITLTSQEVLWVDANKCSAEGPRGAWLSHTITNPSMTTALTDVVVTFLDLPALMLTYL